MRIWNCSPCLGTEALEFTVPTAGRESGIRDIESNWPGFLSFRSPTLMMSLVGSTAGDSAKILAAIDWGALAVTQSRNSGVSAIPTVVVAVLARKKSNAPNTNVWLRLIGPPAVAQKFFWAKSINSDCAMVRAVSASFVYR